jgi:hypothetical protein
MKALFFSPKDGSTTFKIDLVSILKKTNPEILFLPGNRRYHPPLSFFQKISKVNNIYILLESAQKRTSRPLLLFRGGIIQSFPVQHLETSKDYSQISTLHKILPNRIFLKRFLLLMCGEINAYNVLGSLKKGKSPKSEVIIDVVHTNMGHWNHLLRKYEALSKGRRWSIHITNNVHNSVNTSLRIFYDGKEVKSTTYQIHSGQRYACINV